MLDGQRIAIVLLSALGDVVHALPLVASLKAAAPRSRIEWIVQPVPAEVARAHPAVDRVWLFDRKSGWRAYREFRRAMRDERFDVAIDLQVYAKASILTAMLDAERKIGFDRARARELNWLVTTDRIPAHPPGHVADQYLEFADYLGAARRYEWDFALSDAERAAQATFFGAIPAPVAALVIGTSKRVKEWIPERWARTAQALHATWGYEVVIVGGESPNETALAREIVALAPGAVRDVRHQDVRRMIWLIDGSALVVGLDTGPYHMAVALGVPAVGLFGYLDPARVGPTHRFLDLVVDVWREPGEPWHPPRSANRGARVNLIEVDDVLEKVEHARARYPRANGMRR
jgi:heptosyltransferase I